MKKTVLILPVLGLLLLFGCGETANDKPIVKDNDIVTNSSSSESGSGVGNTEELGQNADQVKADLQKIVTKEASKQIIDRCGNEKDPALCLRTQTNNIANLEDNILVCATITKKDSCEDSYYFAKAFRMGDKAICAKIINKLDREYCDKNVKVPGQESNTTTGAIK
jgi:hypothetical protein